MPIIYSNWAENWREKKTLNTHTKNSPRAECNVFKGTETEKIPTEEKCTQERKTTDIKRVNLLENDLNEAAHRKIW